MRRRRGVPDPRRSLCGTMLLGSMMCTGCCPDVHHFCPHSHVIYAFTALRRLSPTDYENEDTFGDSGGASIHIASKHLATSVPTHAVSTGLSVKPPVLYSSCFSLSSLYLVRIRPGCILNLHAGIQNWSRDLRRRLIREDKDRLASEHDVVKCLISDARLHFDS
jgi:hypothetical protein